MTWFVVTATKVPGNYGLSLFVPSNILTKSLTRKTTKYQKKFLARRWNAVNTTVDEFSSQSETSSESLSSLQELGKCFDSLKVDLTTSSRRSRILADDAEFQKPSLDKRSYRAIELENNKLQILLVSDPDTDVEAASAHVSAGHFDDPEDRSGLAHFHEHMVFLSSDEYPEESEFEQFLSKHGGSCNAYTDMADTNYYFSLSYSGSDDSDDETKVSQPFSEALRRFAQFFICPSFMEDAIDRELRAIDSEYLNSIMSDNWRNFQILKSTSNPNHPFSKFGCGNYNTLTKTERKSEGGSSDLNFTANDSELKNAREALFKFWNELYHAQNMRVCVLGRGSLDELQRKVEDIFTKVRETDASQGMIIKKKLKPEEKILSKEEINNMLATLDDPFESIIDLEHPPAFQEDQQIPVLREISPVKISRRITIGFLTPPLEHPLMEASRPHRVISHLMGHEAPGSLHSILSEEGWINGLSSGISVDVSDFSMFQVSIGLTEQGMEHREEVIQLVFDWINMIKDAVESDSDLIPAHHDELRKLSDISFRFKETSDRSSFCSSKAESLFYYKPADILKAPYETGSYSPEIEKLFMKRFTPRNALITVWDPNHKNSEKVYGGTLSAFSDPWKKEKWYKGDYRQIPTPSELMDRWENPTVIDPRLQLPDLNKFVPSDFSLRCDDEAMSNDKSELLQSSPPSVLIKKNNFRLWHKTDRKWRVPKANVRVILTSNYPYSSPRAMTLCRLFDRLLKDDLNSYVYDATMAGISAGINVNPHGFSVKASGYSEKVPLLLETVIDRIFTLLDEMAEAKEDSALAKKFVKALENLKRETKNLQYDQPYESCNYMSRVALEDTVWHVESYLAEIEGEEAEKFPLTLSECAKVMKECLTGSISAEALTMGNIDENGAKDISRIIENRFLQGKSVINDEIRRFRTHKLPTHSEAKHIYGEGVVYPLIYEEMASGEDEENNALELVIQTGCSHELKFDGMAIMDLLSSMVYTSAFNRLRTKEQLGYIVSAFVRSINGGGYGLSVIIQSSTKLPHELQERAESWLLAFRQELIDMSEERIKTEANAVIAQFLEKDTKLSDETGRYWGNIVGTQPLRSVEKEPAFDRAKRLAEALDRPAGELKQKMIDLFDKYISINSPDRRVLSTRVYGQSSRSQWEANKGRPGVLSNYQDVRELKHYLSTYPPSPYWN